MAQSGVSNGVAGEAASGASGPRVEVRRSARRHRTVSAYRSEGRIVVLLPARMSRADEERWVATMVARLERQAGRRRLPRGDVALQAQAAALSTRWLAGRAIPATVRWSDVQRRRWGSCSVGTGDIRISRRLQTMPLFVLDYVLLHELAHLLVADHSAEFWSLLQAYPQLDRARGFLEGVEHQHPDDGSDTSSPDDPAG